MAFGGGGYFEAVLSWDPTIEPQSSATCFASYLCWPAWWAESWDHVAYNSVYWNTPGQPNQLKLVGGAVYDAFVHESNWLGGGRPHFSECDFMVRTTTTQARAVVCSL